MIAKSQGSNKQSLLGSPKRNISFYQDKETPSHTHRVKNMDEEADVLVKACCPNCRYTFSVVSERKLNTLKKKIEESISQKDSANSLTNTQIINLRSPSERSERKKSNTFSEKDHAIIEEVKSTSEIGVQAQLNFNTPQEDNSVTKTGSLMNKSRNLVTRQQV